MIYQWSPTTLTVATNPRQGGRGAQPLAYPHRHYYNRIALPAQGQ